MKRIVFSLPVSKVAVPVSAFGLIFSAAQPAKADQAAFLERRAEKLEQRQERFEHRDLLQAQREMIREARQETRQNMENRVHAAAAVINPERSINAATHAQHIHNINHNVNAAKDRSFFITENGKFKGVNSGVDLDLTSSTRSIKLGADIFEGSGSLSLMVGDQERTFSAGSMATPAEYLALHQKLDSGQPGLVLNQGGGAIDGQILLSSISDAGSKIRASNLVVPVSVDVIGNFGAHGDFKLNGNLVNYGNVFALSNKPEGTSATIGAKNIANLEGAVISTSVPSGIASQFGELNQSLDLNLKADKQFVNFGQIDSSGNLNITAGQSITNGMANNAGTTSGATLSAAGVMNLQAPVVNNAGQIAAIQGIKVSSPVALTLSNSGSIFSATNDITIGTLGAANVTVDNTNGLLSATNGNINIGTSGFTEKINTKVTGGDLLSKAVNIQAGDGDADVFVDNLTGTLNMKSGNAHAGVFEGNLKVGEIDASGDPTLFALTGDLDITTNQTPTENLTLIAGRNVNITSASVFSSVTVQPKNGDLKIIAGADFEQNGGNFIIHGGSTSGGDIVLGGPGAVTIGATTLTAASPGGNVQLIAFAGNEKTGQLSLTAGQPAGISADGAAGPKNVDIFTEGGISSTVPNGGIMGADVTISATRPQIVGGQVVFAANGSQTSGSFSPGTVTTGNISMTAGPGIDSRHNVDINAQNISITGVSASNRAVITSTGTLGITSASVTGPGGVTLVARGALSIGTVRTTTILAAPGDIMLVAGAEFTRSGSQITITGASGVSNSRIFAGVNPSYSANANKANEDAGDITLVTFNNPGSSDISMHIKDITAKSNGTGSNGNVTLISGETGAGLAIDVANIDVSGGAAKTGSVYLANEDINASGTKVINFDGTISSGTFRNSGPLQAGTITVGTTTVDVNQLSWHAGDLTGLPTFTGSTRFLDLASLSAMTFASQLTGQNIAIQSTANITFTAGTDLTGTLIAVSGNSIAFGADVKAVGGVALVASHDITASAASKITTANSSGDSGAISVVAGANFTTTQNDIIISGGSLTGGTLNFNLLTAVESQSATAKGGNVTLVAFSGSDNTGVLNFANGDITTGGANTGSSGEVVVVAAKSGGDAINIGNINTAGDVSGTGNVDLWGATPNATVLDPVTIFKGTAAVVSGDFTHGSTQTGNINVDTITLNQADVTVATKGNVNIGDVIGVDDYNILESGNTTIDEVEGTTLTVNTEGTLTTTGTINVESTFIDAESSISVTEDITSKSVSLTSKGSISLNADIIATDGITLVAAQNISATALVDLRTSNAADCGDITVVAGAEFTTTPSNVIITKGSVTGGNINFNPVGGIHGISTLSTGTGHGGDVTLTAYDADATTPGNGRIFLSAPITTGGSAGQTNGNLTIVQGGKDFGGSIDASVFDTTGGTAGTGALTMQWSLPTGTIDITKATASYTGNFTSGALSGGSWDLRNITSTVAGDVTIKANGGDLNIGTFNGNAAFTNIDIQSQGNIRTANGAVISGKTIAMTAPAEIQLRTLTSLTAPGGIILVAGTNISNQGTINISTTNSLGNAGNFFAISMVTYTNVGGTITITGGSTGSDGRTALDNATINTNSTFTNGIGGNIYLASFGGPTNNARVNLGNVSVSTAGNGSGANGDFILVGGNVNGFGNSINGLVDTSGGAANTGKITVASTGFNGNVAISKPTVAITSGSFLGGASNNSPIDTAGAILAAGGDISIKTANGINLGTLTSGSASHIDLRAGGDLQIRSTTGGFVSASSGNNITLRGSVSAPLGILMVAGNDISNSGSNLSLLTAPTSGSGGDITLISGAAFTQTDSAITITGSTNQGSGGRITLNATGTVVNASGVGNGTGGDINLIAINNTGTSVQTGGDSIVKSAGAGSGTAGNLTVVAQGLNGGTAINMPHAIDFSGGTPGGGSITLSDSIPNSYPVVISTTDGSFTGSFLGGTPANGGIITGPITLPGGTVTIETANHVQTGAINVSGGPTAGSVFIDANSVNITSIIANGGTSGNGGIVDVSTTSNTQLIIGSGPGSNNVGAINVNGGTTSGNGGEVYVTSTGTGGIKIDALAVTVVDGNGGTIDVRATNGPLVLIPTTFDVSGKGGDAAAGGTLHLEGDGISFTGNLNLLANGINGGAGGTIEFIDTVNPVTLGTNPGQVNVSAVGTGGIIDVTAGGTLTVAPGYGILVDNLSLQSLTGNIVIGGNVQGTLTVDLTVSHTNTISTTGTGLVAGGALTVNAGTGAITLATQVTSLNINSNSVVTINEVDDIILNGITANTFNLTAGGDIIQGTGVIDANAIVLISNNGSVGGSGAPILINNGGTGVSLTVDAEVDAYLQSQGTGTVTLNTSSAGQDFFLDAAGPITIPNGATITAGDDLTLVTEYLTNDGALVAGDTINIYSHPGLGLTIDGGTNGGTMTAPTINLTATGGNLTFIGAQQLDGIVNMTANSSPTSSIIITSGASVTGNGTFNVNTPFFDNQGGTFNAPVINFFGEGVTIANSQGNVTLSGNINLIGTDFAIIAAGSVNQGTATTINLSDPSGLGGNLTIVAGFNFLPATSGQQTDNDTEFHTFTPNVAGGNINLSNVAINTSGSAGGGNVNLVANGTTTGTGVIAVGSINTSSSAGTGGSIVANAGKGFTSGVINTAGSTGGGDVSVGTGSLSAALGTTVEGGVLNGGFQVSTAGPGVIQLGAVNVGTGSLNVNTTGAGSSIAMNGAFTGHEIQLSAVGGAIDLRPLTGITTSVDSDGDGGEIFLSANTIAFNSTAAIPFALNANGTVGDGGAITLRTKETPTLQIGAAAKPPKGARFITMSATGAVDGGSLEVETGGQLNVNTASFNASHVGVGTNYDGANYVLKGGANAPKGAGVAITGSLQSFGGGSGDGGDIDITSSSTSAFVIGSPKSVKANGIQGNLTTDEKITVNNTRGGITLARTTALTAGDVEFETGATKKASILTTGGAVITASNSIELKTSIGAIGSKTGLLVSAPGVTANSSGGVVSLKSASGNLVSGTGKSFTVNSDGTLNIGNISTSNGSIIIKNTAGDININDNADVLAANGAITINAINLIGSDINIGDSARVETSGVKGGNVIIAIGAAPKTGTNTSVPSGVTVDAAGTPGQAFFGPGGLDTSAGSITVNVINKNVIFNNLSTSGSLITVEQGVNITADPPSAVGPTTTASTGNMEQPLMGQASSKYIGYISPLSSQNDSLNQLTSSIAKDSINLLPGGGNLYSNGLSQKIPTQASPFGMAVSGVSATSIEDVQDSYMLDAMVWCDEDLGIKNGASVLPRNASAGTTTLASGESETATLRKGCVMFAPQKQTKIETPFGIVNIAAGSMALVFVNESGMGVYDLHDAKKGSVSVKVDKSETMLSPGRCTFIAKQHVRTFHDINPMEAVGYFGITERNCGQGLKVYNSEFSVLHAMNTVKPLSALMATSHPKGRKLTNEFLKTTAILLYLSSSNKHYEFYRRPALSAFAAQ